MFCRCAGRMPRRPCLCRNSGLPCLSPSEVAFQESVPSLSRHICCKPENRCLLPYVDEKTIRPKRCFPGFLVLRYYEPSVSGDNSCPETTACLPALEDNANVTNAIDVMFFCCHSVDIFTCSDGNMPIIDQTTRRPMKCLPSNPMSCPSERVCSPLADGSHACCPHPLLSAVCSEAAVSSDGSIYRCKVVVFHSTNNKEYLQSFEDNSCQEGKCRRAANGDYVCCRVSSPPQHLLHPGIPFVPEVIVSSKRMRAPKTRRRRPFYLRYLNMLQ